jgi:hypothetical protein
MDRWAARAQRRSDERQARWLARRRELASRGQLAVMDRWAARLQRSSDERVARWDHTDRLRKLIPSGPVAGPGGSTAVISVEQTGLGWLRWVNMRPGMATGGTGGAPIMALLVAVLVSLAVWRWVFHRAYTVYLRTNDMPPVKINVRLPDQEAACHAAAQMVSRFQAGGSVALADGTRLGVTRPQVTGPQVTGPQATGHPGSVRGPLIVIGAGLVGLVAFIVAARFIAAPAVPPRTQLAAGQLQPGDCLTGPGMGLGASSPWPDEVTSVPCTRPHLAEVIFAGDAWPQSAAYPGDDAIGSHAAARCDTALTGYTGGNQGYIQDFTVEPIVRTAPPGPAVTGHWCASPTSPQQASPARHRSAIRSRHTATDRPTRRRTVQL